MYNVIFVHYIYCTLKMNNYVYRYFNSQNFKLIYIHILSIKINYFKSIVSIN